MRDDFEGLSAREDDADDEYRPVRRTQEKRRSIAFDIALGIWLGGMALTFSWAVLWMLWMKVVFQALGVR